MKKASRKTHMFNTEYCPTQSEKGVAIVWRYVFLQAQVIYDDKVDMLVSIFIFFFLWVNFKLLESS